MTPSIMGTLVTEFGNDHDSCASVIELACAATKNNDKACMTLESIVGRCDSVLRAIAPKLRHLRQAKLYLLCSHVCNYSKTM
jgi:hypothetical protein